jgi:TonB family protein
MSSSRSQNGSQWITGSLLESKRRKMALQQLIALPISIAIHFIIIIALIILSMKAVTYIENAPVWVGMHNMPSFNESNKSGSSRNIAKKVDEPQMFAPSVIPDNAVPVSLAAVAEKTTLPIFDVHDKLNAKDARTLLTDNNRIEPQIDLATLLKMEPPKRIGIDAQGEQPKIISRIQPAYPEAALRAFIEGMVVLEVIVSKYGTVADVKVLKSLNPMLDQSAVNAVYQWKFEPGKINNVPMNAYMTITVIFKLQQKDQDLSL